MLFADAFAILLVALSLLIAFPSFWILSGVIWPARVEATRQVFEHRRWTTFLVGLPAFLVALLVLLGSMKGGGPSAIFGVLAVGLFLLYCQVGVAGLAKLVGERTAPGALEGASPEPEPAWLSLRRGGLLVAFTYLFPLVGWIGLTFLTTVMGCGAMVRTGIFRVKHQHGGRGAVSETING